MGQGKVYEYSRASGSQMKREPTSIQRNGVYEGGKEKY